MTPSESTLPDTLRDLIAGYLVEQCTVILDADQPLRDGENVVHTTRVAVRRLRSTLRTFADVFDIPAVGASGGRADLVGEPARRGS